MCIRDSLNGVIQKPNSGSYNASNEGFYLEGANGIKFCTAPAAGSSLFVTLIGAATSIGTPSDNTVSEAKLTSDSVSEAKLKVSNSPVAGKFLQYKDNTDQLTWTDVDLTTLSASNLTSGTVPDARFPATLPAASGANLTNLPAANITGTLPAIDGSNLTGIDAGATGTGNDKIFWENGQTVTQSYTIGNTFGSANCNALSAGPITINNNVVVTVGSNSNWTIV